MESLEGIKEILTKAKVELSERYKMKYLGVFGSVSRGEQEDNSDIDIMVDFEEGADLFDLTGLTLFLEEKLKQKVDVVPRRALREEIKESVLKDLIPV
ncbi:MAG: nucleotidyltransferase family protein [Candidatus Auribacterota bacterium]|nr:nucleotidyltransferase family protein [Candidatus Auribacterota bacterium]